MTADRKPRTNPNVTPNTPGLVRLCRAELEAARVRAELAKKGTT